MEHNTAEHSTARELDDLYRDAPFGYHSLDDAGRVVHMNDTELRWLGYARGEVIGKKHFTDMLHPRSAHQFVQNFFVLKRTGRLQEREYQLQRKNGSSFHVSLSAITVTDAAGRFVRSRASVLDIELRKSVESQLRSVSQRLVQVQEAERRALANELHDLVGQKLTALSINLNILQSQLGVAIPAGVSQRLRDTLALVDETIGSIRDVMTALRPAVLDDYGLMAALRWYAEQFTRRTAVSVVVAGSEPLHRPPPPVEEALFRIAQEALSNVAKYAGTGKATVTLAASAEGLSLTVADEGRGFDLVHHCPRNPQGGWGLMIMRERACAVGAELTVDSAPGRGTRVVVTLRRRDAGHGDPRARAREAGRQSTAEVNPAESTHAKWRT